MLVLMIEDKSNGTVADFRREFARRFAHHGSTFSGVGASGKPGAVQSA
jgi:hypothetical protein